MTDQASKSYLKCTVKQRIYIDGRLDGLSKIAAAQAAGGRDGEAFERSELVQAALIERMQAVADEVDFSRKDAHDMYMDAYRNADTAMEQIAAVNSMVKLHGLERPKVIEVKVDHTHSGKLEFMSTEDLMKLAEMEDLTLEGEFEEVTAVPKLGAPEATDDNTQEEPRKVPTVSQDY